MSLIAQFIRADQYPSLGVKSSRLPGCTSSTTDVITVDVAVQLCDILAHEADDGACEERSSVRKIS